MTKVTRILCKNCLAYNDETGRSVGECRRNGPTVKKYGNLIISVWPEIHENNWCMQAIEKPSYFNKGK